ncbi:MAG: hypothetical protein KY475_08710 [Planctomycetes bacterium]|nr:hypothetical protein [Planctomycetota bacterium]
MAVAAGFHHGLALRADGSLAGWGYNGSGRTDVPTGNEFVAIAAGGSHSLALRADGSLAGWGSNWLGQTDVPRGNDFAAVAAGAFHSLALREDGSLAGWGYNFFGQTDVPRGNEFVAIAAGDYYSLALRADGSLIGWGDNFYGQTEVPSGNDFLGVAAGQRHSLALRADGSLVAWGSNRGGQTDMPGGTDFVAIAAGSFHGLAIIGNTPPLANATALVDGADMGPVAVVPCDGGSAVVTLDGSGSTDPDGDELQFEWSFAEGSGIVLGSPEDVVTTAEFPVGVHEVTLTVYDVDASGQRKGGVDAAYLTVTVFDDMPPVAELTTDVGVLWPPNHDTVPVFIYVAASDGCTSPENLLILCSIWSSQPDDSGNEDDLPGDADGLDGYSAPVEVDVEYLGDGLYGAIVLLRAERDGGDKAGRIYSINVDVLDEAINESHASTTVVVPHHSRSKQSKSK